MVQLTSGKTTSKQDYATPPEFIEAVEKRFGKVIFDLAASAHNTKHVRYFTKEDDSLVQDWSKCASGPGILWLNPEFGNIAPFARKCAVECPRLPKGQAIAMLVLASVGSNWYRDHVWRMGTTYFLNGRICFDGVNGYPKDCMLCVYEACNGIVFAGRPRIWRWTENKLY